jgi:hypothetical protein
MKEELRKMYKGNVSFMFKQSNLERNCLDKFLRAKVSKIIENYNTSINSKNLNAAFQKVDEIKAIAGRTITKMAANMEQTEELLKHSQEIQYLSKDFQKNSETLETMMESQSFWMCSRKCLMIFGGVFGFLFLLWIFA